MERFLYVRLVITTCISTYKEPHSLVLLVFLTTHLSEEKKRPMILVVKERPNRLYFHFINHAQILAGCRCHFKMTSQYIGLLRVSNFQRASYNQTILKDKVKPFHIFKFESNIKFLQNPYKVIVSTSNLSEA